jgi:hypothetical protein
MQRNTRPSVPSCLVCRDSPRCFRSVDATATFADSHELSSRPESQRRLLASSGEIVATRKPSATNPKTTALPHLPIPAIIYRPFDALIKFTNNRYAPGTPSGNSRKNASPV